MIYDFCIGALVTLGLFAATYFPGIVFGIATSTLQTMSDRAQIAPVSPIVILSTVPLLAALYWFHYPFQALLHVVWPGWVSAIVVMFLFAWASVHLIFRQVLKSIIDTHLDDIVTLGIPKPIAFKKILIPLALRGSLHRFAALAIVVLQTTMFASLLGVGELFRVAQRLNAEYLRPVEIYTAMAGFYIALSVPLLILQARLERRFLDLYANS